VCYCVISEIDGVDDGKKDFWKIFDLCLLFTKNHNCVVVVVDDVNSRVSQRFFSSHHPQKIKFGI
jgi:hypothetical protein